jgi:hypothetical protein
MDKIDYYEVMIPCQSAIKLQDMTKNLFLLYSYNTKQCTHILQ